MNDISAAFSKTPSSRSIAAVVTFFIVITCAITWFFSQQISPPDPRFSHYFKEMYWLHLTGNWCVLLLGSFYITRKSAHTKVAYRVVACCLVVIAATVIDNAIDKFFFFERSPEKSSYWFFVSITNVTANTFYLVLGIVARLIYDGICQRKVLVALEIAKLQAEVALLKTQTAPHFLFNVLNALYNKASNEQAPETAQGLLLISNLLRYSLYKDMDKRVSIQHEITAINDYLSLEQLRFDQKLPAVFMTDIADENYQLYPMLLMPLIENAIKYGSMASTDEDIVISIVQKADYIEVVTSNLVPETERKEKEDEAGGLGLTNLKQRLEMLYPNNHLLVIEKESGVFHTRLEVRGNEHSDH